VNVVEDLSKRHLISSCFRERHDDWLIDWFDEFAASGDPNRFECSDFLASKRSA